MVFDPKGLLIFTDGRPFFLQYFYFCGYMKLEFVSLVRGKVMNVLAGLGSEFFLYMFAMMVLSVGAGVLVRYTSLCSRTMYKHLLRFTIIFMIVGYFVYGPVAAIGAVFIFGIGAYVFLCVAEKKLSDPF